MEECIRVCKKMIITICTSSVEGDLPPNGNAHLVISSFKVYSND